MMKSQLAAFDALYLKPLLYGLDRPDSPFKLQIDIPAKNALKLREHTENLQCAFLSPIDYARHGAEYCIVPNICVASSKKTDTIQLFLKSELHRIRRIAVDVRFTSEIILTKIILMEKYRNLSSGNSELQFIPMMPDVDTMLARADAALIVNDMPGVLARVETFVLDLVEEWNDLTDLPYVHGFWVGREGELTKDEVSALITAKENGIRLQSQIAQTVARQQNLSLGELVTYLSSFSYDFSERDEEGLVEFIKYAFYHGVIGDVPDIRFYDIESGNTSA